MNENKIPITKIFNPIIGVMLEMLFVFFLIISALLLATFIWYIR